MAFECVALIALSLRLGSWDGEGGDPYDADIGGDKNESVVMMMP